MNPYYMNITNAARGWIEAIEKQSRQFSWRSGLSMAKSVQFRKAGRFTDHRTHNHDQENARRRRQMAKQDE